jgi:cell division protein ZapE
MSGGRYYDNPFTRELGEIADSFVIMELDGKDWRESATERPSQIGGVGNRIVSFSWPELMKFLYETHPMYDAAWLLEVDVIQIEGFETLKDSDQAIRFVRFIDRVYDRAVHLQATGRPLAPDEILAPIRDERRFHLHFIRCQSRLKELIGPGRERMGEVADGTS